MKYHGKSSQFDYVCRRSITKSQATSRGKPPLEKSSITKYSRPFLGYKDYNLYAEASLSTLLLMHVGLFPIYKMGIVAFIQNRCPNYIISTILRLGLEGPNMPSPFKKPCAQGNKFGNYCWSW